MPRDIPVGNGQMLVTFDHHYQIRDLYFPHVGQENHAGGGPCRFGVWADLPGSNHDHSDDRRKKRLYWSDDGWQIEHGYEDETLTTRVKMFHPQLDLELLCNDVVDFHRPVLVRRIEIVNPTDQDRDVHVFHHNDFHLYGTKMGDTAYYDPKLRALVHYRKSRYLMTTWYVDGDQQVHEYATGTAGFRGAEGTWRDAEDGRLGGNSIAQGAVDSTIMCQMRVPANDSSVLYLIIGAGENLTDIQTIQQFIHREGPQGIIDRTTAYWKLWLTACVTEIDENDEMDLPEPVKNLFKRSLLLVRTQIDNNGAIIAANDSDIMQFARDTYSYLWPRDGAFVADAIDAAGFPDISRSFFYFCSTIITEDGYFLHKYTPDGSPASSWHPWVNQGKPQLPIQEDETALVIWALWRHYERYRDIEFARKLWVSLIRSAGDFLLRFRDPDTKLPLPSYDLWEERWGVHSFTVATVYAGLKAAWQFATCFGDTRRAAQYAKAAEETREAFGKHLWSEEHGHFLRRVVPLDHDRTAHLMSEVIAGRIPTSPTPSRNGKNGEKPTKKQPYEPQFERDAVLDSSMAAIFSLGMLDVDDPRVEATMRKIEEHLTVKTSVGGVARYQRDYYHAVTDEYDTVPGNPWFICTLWLADWYIARAKNPEQLKDALPILNWVADHALASGVLAEQVHPSTNAPLSVSPLTWSHATVVATVINYVDKFRAFETGVSGSVIQRRRRTRHDPMGLMSQAPSGQEG